MNKDGIQRFEDQPLALEFRPSHHPLLPVEVLTRSELLAWVKAGRQRAAFHQIIVCFSGEGVHNVDFEPISMSPATVLHVHPGQVQEYQFEPEFDAHIIVYRADLHRTLIPGHEWFPGSDIPTLWDLSSGDCSVVIGNIEALRSEQEMFDGSPAYVVLMESLLAALLARLSLLVAKETPPTRLPEAYVEFRHYLEANLRRRPTITKCASELGYSTRTLDRACQTAVGQTAKQVLDDRIAFEVRRLLTHTDESVTTIGSAFGFVDASSFSKFVRRHFSASPTELREGTDDLV